MKRSKPEIELAIELLKHSEIPRPVFEYHFHDVRRWRFDLAWPNQRLAVEVEGGIFVRGRHNRPSGYIADCLKYSEAAIAGWRVIRIPVTKGWLEHAVEMIKRGLV